MSSALAFHGVRQQFSFDWEEEGSKRMAGSDCSFDNSYQLLSWQDLCNSFLRCLGTGERGVASAFRGQDDFGFTTDTDGHR